jgi:hypothetical protein
LKPEEPFGGSAVFRETIFLGDRKMQSRINLFILICFAGLTTAGFARKSVAAGDANEAAVPSFPYIAQITTDALYIRSGPGTNYYPCGQLNKADRVKVVGSNFSWSRIVPPEGCFSWISMRYVSVGPDNPDIGTVTGDAVRVYAGSDQLKPIHSTSVQLKLNKGDKVRLMGEERDDYYKIAPPDGAYFWVLTEYTEPLGPSGEVPLTAEPQTQPEAGTSMVVPTNIPLESEKLKEYYALTEQIDAERAKPMAQQDYTSIKNALAEIANNKAAGKAARYSELAVKQIKGFELALAVTEEVKLQDTQLQQIQERIDKACAARLADVQDLGRFAVVGRFETSIIYGPEAEPRHYRIVDDSGKTICYAVPVSPALKMDLSKAVHQKVGLVGTIKQHPQTAGALVEFTEIEILK